MCVCVCVCVCACMHACMHVRVRVCVRTCLMVAPSSLAAEAVAKYGKENIKVNLDDGRSTYYAITTRKEYSHIKLITVLPEEKVRLVCVCGGGESAYKTVLT